MHGGWARTVQLIFLLCIAEQYISILSGTAIESTMDVTLNSTSEYKVYNSEDVVKFVYCLVICCFESYFLLTSYKVDLLQAVKLALLTERDLKDKVEQ